MVVNGRPSAGIAQRFVNQVAKAALRTGPGFFCDDLSRESQGLAAGDRARASFGWPTVAAAVARVAQEVAESSGAPRTAAAAS